MRSYDFIGGMKVPLRALRLVWHLINGLFIVTVCFRFLRPDQQDEIISQWSAKCLRILRVQIRIKGDSPTPHASGNLFVANHISWIDVLALNAITPMRFVAKAEIRDWPLIGILAGRIGTIFFTRRPHELPQVKRLMVLALECGRCVALFPEGTTSAGQTVLRFHSGLFESAVERRAPVRPIALRYYREDGSSAQHAAFLGDQSLIESIYRVLSQPLLHLDISFLPVLTGFHPDRYELAHRARAAILSSFHASTAPIMRQLPICGSTLDWDDKPFAAS